MNVQVLISCMNKTVDIVRQSNLFHDVIVINQCDVTKETEQMYSNRVLFIDSPSRGLSRSRNLAIRKSCADICLVSDDDELFVDDVQDKIAVVYESHPDADIIIFKIINRDGGMLAKPHFLSIRELFHVCSVQITFRRKSISEKNIFFDVNMGSGTDNGGGEEVDFLLRCKKRGLRIYYYPLEIAELRESESHWFSGYDQKFFYQRGTSTRHMLGFFISILYAFYWLYTHHHLYRESITVYDALKSMLKGIFDNKINKAECKND